MENYQTTFSSHAEHRAQQRGIRRDVVSFILDEADIDAPAGKGCFSIYVSKRKLKRMVDLNQIKAKFAARVEGVVLIDSDEGLVTIFHKTQRKNITENKGAQFKNEITTIVEVNKMVLEEKHYGRYSQT